MMKRLKNLNLWIACVFVVTNLFAWAGMVSSAKPPYVVDPIRDEEVVQLLDYINSGSHSGETWTVHLTELEAEQTIAWYLQRYPQIPFAHPHVEITPDYVSGEGDAVIAGLRVHVGGTARVTLDAEGLPRVEILDLTIPVPRPIREGLEREIQAQLRRADLLPVRFTSAEWSDGEVVVSGVIR
ncbi:MAG: hypothetical protein JXA21_24590 [Anaerolineae bacterium]|nr:hypothetical protein [Anaerolineae bacterium]